MFKPIDWPEVCYVQEAVYWIALGRVPEFYHDEHGNARIGEDAFQSGELIGDFDWAFTELEFAWAGVNNVDYDRYEPRRVCRRLQLLRKWSHYEQDNEQVFT